MNSQDTFEVDNLQGPPKIILETPSGLENTIRSIDEGILEETEKEIDESQVIEYTFFSIFFCAGRLAHFCKSSIQIFGKLNSSGFLKFMYSEKATKFCEIFTLLLSYVVPVESKVKISQNFLAFSEYTNFTLTKLMFST